MRTRYLFFNFREWLVADKLGQSRDDAEHVSNRYGLILSNLPMRYGGNPVEDENAEGDVEFRGQTFAKTAQKYAGQPVYACVTSLEKRIWEGIRKGQDFLTWVDPSLRDITVSHVKPEDRNRCKAILRVILEWKQATAAASLSKFLSLASEASADCVNYRFRDQHFDGGMTLLHSLSRTSDAEISGTEVGQENGVKMAMMLLSRGADVNKIDFFGFTPLHRAMLYNGGHTILAKFLCANGADLTARSFGQWWATD